MSKSDLQDSINDYINFHKKYTKQFYNAIKSNSAYLQDEDIKDLLYSYDPAYRLAQYCIEKQQLKIDITFEAQNEKYIKLLKSYDELTQKLYDLENEMRVTKEQYDITKRNLNLIQKKYESFTDIDSENIQTDGIETIEEIKEIVENNQSLTPGSDSSNGEIYRDYLTDSSTQWD